MFCFFNGSPERSVSINTQYILARVFMLSSALKWMWCSMRIAFIFAPKIREGPKGGGRSEHDLKVFSHKDDTYEAT